MIIQVRVTGDGAEDELRSFYKWLIDDPDVRHHATVTLNAAEVERTAMGGSLDLIQLVIGSGFQMANLAIAYASWRATRRRAPELTIVRGDTVIKLSKADADEAARLLRSLEGD